MGSKEIIPIENSIPVDSTARKVVYSKGFFEKFVYKNKGFHSDTPKKYKKSVIDGICFGI